MKPKSNERIPIKKKTETNSTVTKSNSQNLETKKKDSLCVPGQPFNNYFFSKPIMIKNKTHTHDKNRYIES